MDIFLREVLGPSANSESLYNQIGFQLERALLLHVRFYHLAGAELSVN
jgi:hypothetical protein